MKSSRPAFLWLLALLALVAACGGPGATLTPTPLLVATATPSPVPTPTAIAPTPTATVVPTQTPVPTPTPSPTALRTATPPPTPTKSPASVPVYSYKVVNVFPHDSNAFTQGLVFDNGLLYEGTGLLGRSTLRRVSLETGVVQQVYSIPAQEFGEGIVIFGDKGDRIVQLTWRSHRGYVYDKDSFALLETFSYPTEGWGITWDGRRLIMSDGTATLHFLDPATLLETGSVPVRDVNGPVTNLNELEYIDGIVYANVWLTTRIVMISPETGSVVGWIELKGLVDSLDKSKQPDVLNGIAWDAAGKRLFVTGKLWPSLFEIELLPQG